MYKVIVYMDTDNNVCIQTDSFFSGIADKCFDKSTARKITEFVSDMNPFRVIKDAWTAFKGIANAMNAFPYRMWLIK